MRIYTTAIFSLLFFVFLSNAIFAQSNISLTHNWSWQRNNLLFPDSIRGAIFPDTIRGNSLGLKINLNYDYYFWKERVGIGLSVGYLNYPVDSETAARFVNELLYTNFFEPLNILGIQSSIEVAELDKRWNGFEFSFRPSVRLINNEKWGLQVSGKLGFTKLNVPDLSVRYIIVAIGEPIDPVNYLVSAGDANNFVFSYGGNIIVERKLNKRLKLLLQGDFTYLEMNSSHTNDFLTNPVVYVGTNRFVTFGGGIGLSYQFGELKEAPTRKEKSLAEWIEEQKIAELDIKKQTLSLIITCKSTNSKINLSLDHQNSTNDSLTFSGELRQLSDNDIVNYLDIRLSREEIKALNFPEQDKLKEQIIDINFDTSQSQSTFFNDYHSLRVENFNFQSFEDGGVENYDGVYKDREGNETQFYAMTDPIPILAIFAVVAVGSAIAYWSDDDEDGKKENEYIEARKAAEQNKPKGMKPYLSYKTKNGKSSYRYKK